MDMMEHLCNAINWHTYCRLEQDIKVHGPLVHIVHGPLVHSVYRSISSILI